MLMSALYQTNTLSWIFIQFTETTVRVQTCRSNRKHYSDSVTISLCSFSLMLRPQRRSNKYKSLKSGFTRPGLEPTIYQTRGEHTNHYTTDEPTIYHTRGEHTNHYTTDAVKLLYVWAFPMLNTNFCQENVTYVCFLIIKLSSVSLLQIK